MTDLMRAMDFMVKAFPSAAIRRRPKLRSVARSLPQEKMCSLLTHCSQE
jgi:hypothetical protein